MSSQNPPDSPEPADESTASAQTPPPPPPAAEAPATEEAAAPAPPAKPRRGKLLAAVAAALVVLLVIAGGAFFLLRPVHHKITTPDSAGSMKRDTGREKQLSSQLRLAEQQFKTQGKGKCATVKYVKSAVYNQTSAKRGPAGDLVFLGAKLSKEQKPSKWTTCFSKLVKTNGLTVRSVEAGGGDAKAVCATVTSPQKVTVCGWATKDTVGELVPTVPGYDSKQLSKIMLDVRDDVEQTE